MTSQKYSTIAFVVSRSWAYVFTSCTQ